MRKNILLTACILALLLTSCISLYTAGGSDYYSDGIYYTPPKTSKSIVVANAPQPTYYEEPVVIASSNPRVIEGYWMGGWDGSNADLERAYTIIQNYPNGFGYMAGGVNVAESMAFSSDWNVFVADGKYWWFPTTSNIEFYTDFLFGPYPSSNIVLHDYTPYNVNLKVKVSLDWYNSSYYNPWYYSPWNYHHSWYYDPWYYDPWHYDPWYYDPWHHHHYGPTYYHPHHGPTYHHPHHGPKPGYRHYGPEHTRPNHAPSHGKPNRRPDDKHHGRNDKPGKPGPSYKPSSPNKPSNSRPNQGKWRPTTTPSGNQTITPGTTQRPSVGGGVVGGNGAPKGNQDNIIRPSSNNNTAGNRVNNNDSRTNSVQKNNTTTTGNKVTRTPANTKSNKVTNTTTNRARTVSRPTNTNTNRATRPTGSSIQNRSISRPTGGSISRPTGGGASRSVGGGGGSRISRTR